MFFQICIELIAFENCIRNCLRKVY